MKQQTNQLLMLLSQYLNDTPCAITPSQIKNVMACGVSESLAFDLLLKNYLQVDDTFFKQNILGLAKLLDPYTYQQDLYYKNISLNHVKEKNWQIKKVKYRPYELFVYDDFKTLNDKLYLHIGYFNVPFYYLAVYQNQRLWMSITPNEINTMKKPIQNAFGNVLTFGLGLGYFAYMTSLKENVNQVIIVEKDLQIIELFKKYILPQFQEKNKISIIHQDAFDFLNTTLNHFSIDYIFVDIYHDVSDGIEVYKKFHPYEVKFSNIIFEYWIMDTISYYL